MEITGTSSNVTTLTPLRIYFNQVVSAKANRYLGVYKLPETMKDGTYKITKLTFYDKKDKTATEIPTTLTDSYNNKTFCIDSSSTSFVPVFEKTDTADLVLKPHINKSEIRKLILKFREQGSYSSYSAGWDDIQGLEFFDDSYTITGLDYGKIYEYEITGINKYGNAYRTCHSISTPAYPMDSVTYTLKHNTGTTKDSITVNWNKPKQGNYKGVYIVLLNSNNSPIDSYSIREDSSGTGSYTFENLYYAMKFIVKVYSVTSDISETTGYTVQPYVSPELYTRPEKSDAFVEDTARTDTSIKISGLQWNRVTRNKIKYAKAGSNNWSPYIETTDSSYTIEGLEPTTNYKIKVIPCYYDAEGEEITIEAYTRPGKVKNVRITSETVTDFTNYSKLHIYWEKPSGDIASYIIKIYAYGNSNWETNPFITETISYREPTDKLINPLGGLGVLTRYKVEIITTSQGDESEPYTEEIWTSPDPTTLTINTQSNGKVVEFVYSYKNNLAPYNNSNTTKKFYLCYGATEEEVLSGNYCIDITNDVSTQTSGNIVTCTIGYPFNSDTIKNIINTIGTPDCYFAIQTKLPDSPYNGADFYSNVVSYTLPPLPITPSTTYTYNSLGGLNSRGYWKVNAADVSSEGITLKWTNPQVWDSIKIYVYTSFTEKQLITTITKSNPVEQYIVNDEYFQNAYISRNSYIFIVQTEYKNLKSEEVELWAQKTW